MIFKDIIVQNFDIKFFLESRSIKTKHIGGQTQYLLDYCPFCGKFEHCGINFDNRVFGCFRCHTGGSFVKLVGKIIGKPYFETLDFMSQEIQIPVENINFLKVELNEFKQIESDISAKIKPIDLPEGYVPLGDSRIPYLDGKKHDRDNARAFPIPQDQIKYYKMGYCPIGKYVGRLVVCDVNDKQEPIFWIARDITGLVPKKWKVLNPNATLTQVGSSDLLFNYYLARNYDIGVITEGVFDAIHVGNSGLATYGEGLKKTHLCWLLMGNFKRIVLLYDPDVPDKRLEKSATLLSLFFPVSICKLPYGDPDEWPRDKLWEYILNAPPYYPSKINKLEI